MGKKWKLWQTIFLGSKITSDGDRNHEIKRHLFLGRKAIYQSRQHRLVHSVMSESLNPMDCSISSFPVHHQLPELTQTHAHWVSDAIQPSHPLLSPPPTFNHSQNQGLFQWVNSLHHVAKVLQFQETLASCLPMNIQEFPLGWFPLGWTGWICLQSKGLSRVSSNTTVQEHQFFSAQLSL